MKTYRFNAEEGLNSLICTETETPVPAAHEVLVRVRATSLNYRDLMLIENRYGQPARPGVIPLSDGAGEVVAVGAGVTRAKVGDRVAGTFFAGWIGGPFSRAAGATQRGSAEDGFLATHRVIGEESFVHIPDYLSYEEAATLPCAALTAWNTLTQGRGIRAGDTVLTLGTGGVSLFAVQLAKALGARVVSTTSSDKKGERLTALGADHVINYSAEPDWHKAVRRVTGGEGVDCVVEVVGAATLEKSLKSVAIGGDIGLIGGVGGGKGSLDLVALSQAIVTLRRIIVGSRVDFEAMNRALVVHKLHPVIDRVFPFADAPAAYRHLASAAHVGKIVIAHDN
ncbi:MAG: NAD(P)-dependent alcohol dehydrogenase [Parvibaculum sp.]|nr:NAD(P)-dependent alcohol dehydrogenase [Parvibaculum sp.]